MACPDRKTAEKIWKEGRGTRGGSPVVGLCRCEGNKIDNFIQITTDNNNRDGKSEFGRKFLRI